MRSRHGPADSRRPRPHRPVPSFEEALGIAWTDNVRPHAVVITVLGGLVAVPWRPRGHPRPAVHLTVASAIAVACNVLMPIRHLQLPTG
ncbi:hypothetical protein [Streptomyces hydrogenans]|uniref:hypothetical protein n=1 Tax=Streptomyces hydrogenans TaxID=1873719 RepID=UPI00382D0EAD